MQIVVVVRESEENHGSALVKCFCPLLELLGCAVRIMRSVQLREILEGSVIHWVTTTELEVSETPESMTMIETFREIMRVAVKKARIAAAVEIFKMDTDGAVGSAEETK
jgi:hypothetical protein